MSAEPLPTTAAFELHRKSRSVFDADRARRHYDTVDAEAIVRRLERDYGVRLRYEQCPLRRGGLQHIELEMTLTERQRSILTSFVDGYMPRDLGPDRATTSQIGAVLSSIAQKTGLLSRHQLVAVTVYFGIVTPTIMHERGEYT